MSKFGIIYRVKSPSNKLYIGQTIQTLRRRQIDHISNANNPNNERYSSKFSKAIRKYGSLPEWSVMFGNIPIEYLDKLEIWAIKHYDTYQNGYNSTLGGDMPPMLGRHHTLETRAIISKKAKLREPNRKGAKHTSETIEKLRQQKTGKQHSQQTKHKMSLARSGEKHWASVFTWEDIDYIRSQYPQYQTQCQLAKHFNVKPSTISDIIRYKTWNKRLG